MALILLHLASSLLYHDLVPLLLFASCSADRSPNTVCLLKLPGLKVAETGFLRIFGAQTPSALLVVCEVNASRKKLVAPCVVLVHVPIFVGGKHHIFRGCVFEHLLHSQTPRQVGA